MYTTTTSITLLITLLFRDRISWLFTGAHILHTKYSYKHLNLLVILLFTCKVLRGCLIIFSFAQFVIKQRCGAGHYIELHVRSGHQHEQAYLLYDCAFIHRRIYPRLVHVSRPCSFLKHYLLFIYSLLFMT